MDSSRKLPKSQIEVLTSKILNGTGVEQFVYQLDNGFQITGIGIISVSFDAANKKIIVDSSGGTNKMVITTSTNITTNTTDVSGNIQDGKTVMIDNGASNITITVNGGPMFLATYEKLGTGTIVFAQGSGRTLNAVDGTLTMDGKVGSTASISSYNTTDNIRISNAF